MAHFKFIRLIAVSGIVGGIFVACGGDSNGGGTPPPSQTGSPEATASTCEVAEDCYPNLDPETLAGEPLCLDRVRDGHCTHLCEEDADCCAAEGECRTGIPQVCAPFESTGQRMCFLSCEDREVEESGLESDNVYCQREAGRDFLCRSTGGGAANRKVCLPVDCGVGAACVNDEECPEGQTCLREFFGGYCSARDCQSNDECPGNSVCVVRAEGNLCLAPCGQDGDCATCRGEIHATACVADVELADAETRASVCQPVVPE
jgi:hypothetical protein